MVLISVILDGFVFKYNFFFKRVKKKTLNISKIQNTKKLAGYLSPKHKLARTSTVE